MFKCGYCGKEHENKVTHCVSCGSALSIGHEFTRKIPAYQFPDLSGSPLIIFLRATLGSTLLISGLFFLIGGLLFKAMVGDAGEPGVYGFGILFGMVFVVPFLLISFFSAVTICVNRCRSTNWGQFAAFCAFAFIVASFFLKPLRLFYPVKFLALFLDSTTAFFLGSTLQLLLAAWLLGWIAKPQRSRAA